MNQHVTVLPPARGATTAQKLGTVTDPALRVSAALADAFSELVGAPGRQEFDFSALSPNVRQAFHDILSRYVRHQLQAIINTHAPKLARILKFEPTSWLNEWLTATAAKPQNSQLIADMAAVPHYQKLMQVPQHQLRMFTTLYQVRRPNSQDLISLHEPVEIPRRARRDLGLFLTACGILERAAGMLNLEGIPEQALSSLASELLKNPPKIVSPPTHLARLTHVFWRAASTSVSLLARNAAYGQGKQGTAESDADAFSSLRHLCTLPEVIESFTDRLRRPRSPTPLAAYYGRGFVPCVLSPHNNKMLAEFIARPPLQTLRERHERVCLAISELRERILDQRGVLDESSGRFGDPNMDRFADLILGRSNVALVLHAHEISFDQFSQFLPRLSPEQRAFNLALTLYRESASVRACIDAMVARDGESTSNALPFLAALLIPVSQLKASLLSKTDQLREAIIVALTEAEHERHTPELIPTSSGSRSSAPQISPTLTNDFWNAVGQDQNHWIVEPQPDGRIHLTRLGDQIEIEIPRKLLQHDPASWFTKALEKALTTHEFNHMLASLQERHGLVVGTLQSSSSSTSITTIKHPAFSEPEVLPPHHQSRMVMLRTLQQRYADYDHAFDQFIESIEDLGVVSVPAKGSKHTTLLLDGAVVATISSFPSLAEMRTTLETVESLRAARERSREEETRRREHMQSLASPLLPQLNGPNVVLDNTALLNLHASHRNLCLLDLLDHLAKSGAHVYITSTVLYECTGTRLYSVKGRRRADSFRLFSTGSQLLELLKDAPLLSLEAHGESYAVRSIGSPSPELAAPSARGRFIIVETDCDRRYFQEVRRAKGAYMANPAAGHLSDVLRARGLIGRDAGDRSIERLMQFFWPTRSANVESAAKSRGIIVTDDTSWWRGSVLPKEQTSVQRAGTAQLLYYLAYAQSDKSSPLAEIMCLFDQLARAVESMHLYSRYLQDQKSNSGFTLKLRELDLLLRYMQSYQE